MNGTSRWIVLALGCSILGATTSAAGQTDGRSPQSEPVRVRVESTDCVDAERFYREISARTALVRQAAGDEPARTVIVTVTPEATGVAGSLRFRDEGRETDARVFHAATCDEAVTAMALAAALSIDPNSTNPSPGAPVQATPSLATVGAAAAVIPPAAPTKKPDAESSVAPPRTTAGGSAPEFPERPAVEPAPPSTTRWSFSLGGTAEADATQGLGEDVALSPGIYVGISRDLSRHVALDLRLAAQRTEGSSVSMSEGTGKPTWLTLDPMVCPFRWLDHVISACADVQAGTLQVSATGADTSSQTKPWVALGLAGRITWPDVALGPKLALVVDAQLGARAPLMRDNFHFLDNPSVDVVYVPPALVAHGEIDVGLRFR